LDIEGENDARKRRAEYPRGGVLHLSVLLPSPIMTYHEETKHSELSIRTSAHYLDWDNRPSPFKRYRGLPSIRLPWDFAGPSGESLDAVRGVRVSKGRKGMDLGTLAELLFFSAGLTRRVKFGPDFYYMRAASATGALYPIELYVVCGEIPGLGAGVYHFNPFDFALARLREGDQRGELAAACGDDCLRAPVSVILTSLAWRNAWKYGARSYRHWFWDSGVIAANLLAVSAAEGLDAKVQLGFVDFRVDGLLGLKRRRETTVAVVPVGVGLDQGPRGGRKDVAEISPEYEPLSREEVEYPSMWEVNEASSLDDLDAVEKWRRGLSPQSETGPSGRTTFPLQILKDTTSPAPLADTILRRGSTRKFAREAITFGQLSAIIDSSTRGVTFDFLPADETLVDFYLTANQVQGLPSGSYFFDREEGSLVRLKEGRFRSMSAYLCLEQPLFGDASAVFFLVADLGRVLSSLGDRGYRAAQFEAGARAGKVYLSSYSLGLGASGSTFYDDAVTEFFSPHAKGKSTMIAVGVGVPAHRARPGKVLPQFSRTR